MWSHKRGTQFSPPSPRLGHDLIARSLFTAPAGAQAPEAKRFDSGRRRIMLTLVCFAMAFSVVAGRLLLLGLSPADQNGARVASVERPMPEQRRDITDRNGEVMATDIITASLYADARKVQDPQETARLLASVLPELDRNTLEDRLSSDRAFVWLMRDMTPREQVAVHNLGQPGLSFQREQKRVYPNGHIASHVLGGVDIDNQGIAGI